MSPSDKGGHPSDLFSNSGDEDRSGQAPGVFTALTGVSTDEIDASLRASGDVVWLFHGRS